MMVFRQKVCLHWVFKLIARPSECLQFNIMSIFYVCYSDLRYVIQDVKNLACHKVTRVSKIFNW